MKVFLDTNVLLHVEKLKVNIQDSIDNLIGNAEILIHPMVEAEIISALLDKGKKGQQANLAMQLLSHFSQYLDDKEYPGTDTALLITAKRENGIVFTLDLALKKRCSNAGIPVISSYKFKRLKLYGQDF